MRVHLDALVAEIGSTITSVSAFRRLDDTSPEFLGQGYAATSVLQGDVRVGLENAVADLEARLGKKMEYDNFLAASSAAGGLKMSVHGLVKDMTARAAREAALGAGANVHMMTAGRMRKSDIDVLLNVDPNIILLAGGTDYGERDTALHNARLLAAAPLSCPVIYAGNIQNREEVTRLFQSAGCRLYIVDNVYPGIDELDVEPARRIIQNVFEEYISHAPGMEHIREMVDGTIIPTPGAVMEAAKLLRGRLRDLCAIDVGGATTDVHTVCEDSEEYGRLLISPEPLAKRTVEGDLGTYVNRMSVLNTVGDAGIRRITDKLSETEQDREALIQAVEHLPPIPRTPAEASLAGALAEEAARIALERHSGRIRTLYGPGGKVRTAEGKDLTGIALLIATGGALVRLPDRTGRLHRVLSAMRKDVLSPPAQVDIAFDDDYLMSSCGVLSSKWPDAAFTILMKSLGIEVPA